MIIWFIKWVKRSPLAAYFLLVFGIEWLLVILLSNLLPPAVALLIGSWEPNDLDRGGILIAAATIVVLLDRARFTRPVAPAEPNRFAGLPD